MNIYDPAKIDGYVDCYFQEYEHFFKKVSVNGYVNYLNDRFMRIWQ
jgi:hypothetical protein